MKLKNSLHFFLYQGLIKVHMKGTGALKLKAFFIIVYGQENLCQEIYGDAPHTTDPATEKKQGEN